MSPEERFSKLVARFASMPQISVPGEGRGFGSSALRCQGKIFAMFVGGRLVVKLPKQRVDVLLRAGEGARFDANKGTPMKEWFSLDPTSHLDWTRLTREALAFVAPK